MIKGILKTIIYLLVFIYLIIYFLPKEQLYYFGLQEANNQEITVSNETFLNKEFGFSIKDANVQIKGIESATVKNLDTNILLFNNTIRANDITISASFKKFVPSSIENISIQHSIMNPLFVNIVFDGKDYRGDGYYDIVNQTLVINLYPSNKFVRTYSMLLKQMKKINAKEYRYEYSL